MKTERSGGSKDALNYEMDRIHGDKLRRGHSRGAFPPRYFSCDPGIDRHCYGGNPVFAILIFLEESYEDHRIQITEMLSQSLESPLRRQVERLVKTPIRPARRRGVFCTQRA